MESPYAPLSESCAKALGDKVYDKRKVAVQEIEKMVTEFHLNNNSAQIRKLIEVLSNHFVASRDANKRKGGLIGLAATGLGLGKNSDLYVSDLVSPILNCLNDQDVRVRYLACESLYNVVKVSRAAIIPFFPELFAALSKLVADSDQNVKSGSEILDKLLRDVIIESSQYFKMEAFIPMLRERIYVKNSFVSQYVISWISTLNSVPEINMVFYLTDIIDGLFTMLEDNAAEVQKMSESTLTQFLKTIRNEPNSVQMKDTMNILITHAQSPHELIKSIALTWIREFVIIFGFNVLPYASGIFTAILPCLEYNEESMKNIKECAVSVNKCMMRLVSSKDPNVCNTESMKEMDLSSIMLVLLGYLTHNSVQTKVAVLEWIHHLLINFPNEMSSHLNNLSDNLLGVLADKSDDVILKCISVLAEIVNSQNLHTNDVKKLDNIHYRKFLFNLVNLFNEDKSFLDNRASLIIRQLCVLLDAEDVYITLSDIIANDVTNLKFASVMVRLLNNILFTSSELFEIRSRLRNICNEGSMKLFHTLYLCWVHCPVSTITLCLLAQCYQHVSELVVLLGDVEITLDILTELDKLVQLIETPIFASLRLSLVSKANEYTDAQNLSHALFGILMLLPQTEAFNMLKNRLQCVPNYWGIRQSQSKHSLQHRSKIDFEVLIEHFKKIQKNHRKYRMQQRKRSFLIESG